MPILTGQEIYYWPAWRESEKRQNPVAILVDTGAPELLRRESASVHKLAILGMRKAEIKSKFDEIVDFSGCERYIDPSSD